MGKKPKDRRGTAQDECSALIFALPIPSGLRPSPLDKGSRPPVPHYGGRVPARLCKISGAQNLSGDLRFLPGHWALASPKFQSVRFLFRAWLYRANAPSAHTAPQPSPLGEGAERSEADEVRRGGTPGPPAGRPVSAPYEKEGTAFSFAVGAGVLTRPPRAQIHPRKTVWAAPCGRPLYLSPPRLIRKKTTPWNSEELHGAVFNSLILYSRPRRRADRPPVWGRPPLSGRRSPPQAPPRLPGERGA